MSKAREQIETAEKMARLFHEKYELYAPTFGYETRKASAVPWEDVPQDNKQLMISVCNAVLTAISKGEIPGVGVCEGCDSNTGDSDAMKRVWTDVGGIKR